MRSIITILLLAASISAFGQVDKRDVRRGNRDFKKENYKAADVDYRKALLKDSTSFAANYNLANALYKLSDGKGQSEAQKYYKAAEEGSVGSKYESDYWFNSGDAALAAKDYQAAVDAFKKSLLLSPEDVAAKENYIYAKAKLEEQQQKQQNGQNNQDQNQDQTQQQNPPKQDQSQSQQPQQQGISPQQAQQMLQAIQAKEKETQDKVNKEKAAALQSRQKEKNW